MEEQRRPWDRALRVLWIVGVLGALALMVGVIVDAASGLQLSELRIGWLVLSAGAFSVAWLGFALAWVALNAHGSALQQAAAWTRSQLLRYLPGAIWAPMARAAKVPGRPSQRAATVVVEALIFVATAACVGGLVGGLAIDARLLAAVPAPIVALAIVHWGGRRFSVTMQRAFAATLWLLPSWLLYGLAAAAGQAAVGPGPSVAAVVAASLVAWAAGFVVVFAPGGAGVREVVYGSLLAGTAPLSGSRQEPWSRGSRSRAREFIVTFVLAALARRGRPTPGDVPLPVRVAGDADQPGSAGGDGDGLEARP